MTRGAEAALLSAAVLLAAMGVALVNFAGGAWLDAQVALTLLVFAVAIGAIHVSPSGGGPPHANPFLFPLAAFLTAIGFVEVYRLNPRLASIQRWSLLHRRSRGCCRSLAPAQRRRRHPAPVPLSLPRSRCGIAPTPPAAAGVVAAPRSCR